MQTDDTSSPTVQVAIVSAVAQSPSRQIEMTSQAALGRMHLVPWKDAGYTRDDSRMDDSLLKLALDAGEIKDLNMRVPSKHNETQYLFDAAVATGKDWFASTLYERGAPSSTPPIDGSDPVARAKRMIYRCLSTGCYRAAAAILKAHPSVSVDEATMDDWSLLEQALNPHREVCLFELEPFLERSRDLNAPLAHSKSPPIHHAVYIGRLEIVRWLVEHFGVRLDTLNATGQLPVGLAHYYVQTCHQSLDASKCSAYVDIANYLASRTGEWGVVGTLQAPVQMIGVCGDVRVPIRKSFHAHPLQHASGFDEIVIRSGAHPQRTDKRGKSGLQVVTLWKGTADHSATSYSQAASEIKHILERVRYTCGDRQHHEQRASQGRYLCMEIGCRESACVFYRVLNGYVKTYCYGWQKIDTDKWTQNDNVEYFRWFCADHAHRANSVDDRAENYTKLDKPPSFQCEPLADLSSAMTMAAPSVVQQVARMNE